MRTLIIGGCALLMLAAAAPALTSYHAAPRESGASTSIQPSPPMNHLHDPYLNHQRGNSFLRFHPEQILSYPAPDLQKLVVKLISQKKDTSLNGQWFLQPTLPSDTATGQFPTLRFNLKNKTFTGNTGCNTMSGAFVKTDSSFHFNDNVRLSKKICTGYNEAAFLKNLFMANRYSIEDSVMTLWFDQTQLSRWTRKPQKASLLKRA
jgi:heat shock protein HslJ